MNDAQACNLAEDIGFVFDSIRLFSYLTVVENALPPLAVTSYLYARQRSIAAAILEKRGTVSRAHRLLDELRGGEQERVAIDRALVNQPPFFLPTIRHQPCRSSI